MKFCRVGFSTVYFMMLQVSTGFSTGKASPGTFEAGLEAFRICNNNKRFEIADVGTWPLKILELRL